MILPSGAYFSLDHAEFRRLEQLIEEARALHDPPNAGVRLSRFQASLWEEFQKLGVIETQATAWVRRCRVWQTQVTERIIRRPNH